MFVEDMTLEEAWQYEDLLRRRIMYRAMTGGGRSLEQLEWDYQDVLGRIQLLDPTEGTQ